MSDDPTLHVAVEDGHGGVLSRLATRKLHERAQDTLRNDSDCLSHQQQVAWLLVTLCAAATLL